MTAYDRKTMGADLVDAMLARAEPGARYVMVIPDLPADRQPTGVHTIDRIEDGVVYWKEGGTSPLSALARGNWRRLDEDRENPRSTALLVSLHFAILSLRRCKNYIRKKEDHGVSAECESPATWKRPADDADPSLHVYACDVCYALHYHGEERWEQLVHAPAVRAWHRFARSMDWDDVVPSRAERVAIVVRGANVARQILAVLGEHKVPGFCPRCAYVLTPDAIAELTEQLKAYEAVS